MEFLYVDFLYNFKMHFISKIENKDQGNEKCNHLNSKSKYLNYNCKKFRTQMSKLLLALEPRKY